MNNKNTDKTNPPGVSVPNVWLWLSVLVSTLVTTTSLLGILSGRTYSRETEAWAVQAVGQDYANLVVAVLLLVSTWLLSRHSLRAYLVWLGAYLYLFYAFAIYAFAVHFQFLFLAYVAVLGLSFYALVGGLTAVDIDELATAMPSGSRAKSVSILLMVIGVLFSLLWLSEIVPNLLAGSVPQTLKETNLWVNPVHVLDLGILLPAMVITSVLLWRRKALGYVLSVPLLVFAMTMGLGIIAMFAISAARGLPYSLPAAALIGIIMLLSALFSSLYLRGMAAR